MSEARGPHEPASVLRGRPVLVIDDEPALCDMLARHLRLTGAVVSSVHSATAALEAAAKAAFDLVLLDKRLGADDGVALIGALLAQQPQLAIVVMTGFASVDDSLAALEAGAVGYLLKPFHSIPDVIGELEGIVEREERRRRATVPPPGAVIGGQATGRRSQPPEARGGLPSATVLLVLPHDGERIRLQRALEERGLGVERVEGAAELAALIPRGYDAVVVDAELAGGDGIVALERARSMSRKIALILVGSTPSLDVTTRLLRLGRALFLRRPLDGEAAAKIERALARMRASS